MAKSELRFSGDERDIIRAYAKAEQRQRKYTSAVERENQKLRRIASKNRAEFKKTNEESFGSGAVRQIKQYAAAAFGIGSAFAAAQSMARQMREEIDRGVQKTREFELPIAELAQIATPSRPLSTIVGEVMKTTARKMLSVLESIAIRPVGSQSPVRPR